VYITETGRRGSIHVAAFGTWIPFQSRSRTAMLAARDVVETLQHAVEGATETAWPAAGVTTVATIADNTVYVTFTRPDGQSRLAGSISIADLL
jgi:hypothetical protein